MDAPAFDLRFFCALSVTALLGCSENTEPKEVDSTEDTSEVAPPGFCELQGLSSVEFAQGPYGSNFGDIAADFELNTLDGHGRSLRTGRAATPTSS